VPIRTPRGRAAAYRSLWQWPLRSPVHLAVTAVVVIAVVAGLGMGLGALSGGGSAGGTAATGTEEPEEPGSSRSSASSGSTPVPTALPPVPDLEPTPLPLASAAPEALDVAARWAAAWVDHPPGVTVEQWSAGMRPLTTQEYFAQLAQVDPANVPASRVTGEPRAVRVAPNSVQVDVPTDTLTLRLLVVVDFDGSWRVSGYDRA
jgi:hypothetical protein